MSNSTSKPLITYQTGADECYLIGTKDELILFAKSIIDPIESAEPKEFWGENARVHHFNHGILDGKAEIGIDEVVVVDSDKEKDDIFYKIYNS